MKFAPRSFPLIVALSLVLGCSPASKSENGNKRVERENINASSEKSPANDNIEELESTIRLPFHPEDALWRDDPVNGDPARNRRKLIAVLKFSGDQANRIIEEAVKNKPGQPLEIETETWFPPELIAKSQESGNETIKGTSYAAIDFFQAPFVEGRLTRIDGTNFFVVELLEK
jgi:hypothetical protein